MGFSESDDTDQNVETQDALRTTPPRPRKSKTGLTVITVVIAVIVVLVVVPLAFYLWISGSSNESPPGLTATYSKVPIAGGEQVNIVAISRTDVPWDQIKVQVSNGTDFWEWNTNTADLDGGSAVTYDYGSKTGGGLTVWLNVTDVGGNGFVSGGDYFTVTANPAFPVFYASTEYWAVLIYTNTHEKIGTGIYFTG